MKRIMALILAALLLALSASALADGPKFVTIQEWLEARGDCGDCLMLIQIREVLNPVLAVAEDETGHCNLYTSLDGDLAFNFFDQGEDPEFYRHYIFVISNPKYNEYEGTVEIAGWKLERVMPCILN